MSEITLGKSRTLFVVFTSILVLTGCLSSEDSAEPTNDSPEPPPPVTNTAPVISGTPGASVLMGNAYSFTPSASDADGDTLTFSIENQPSWTSFNSNSGQLSGTPTVGSIGIHSNITITVNDGTASTSLPSFSIEVVDNAAGSTEISWTAPQFNDDGSPLTDLAGFVIYYGTGSGNYTNEINIDNPSVSSFLVENLTPDTYYFAMTARNSGGLESRLSGEAIKVVN